MTSRHAKFWLSLGFAALAGTAASGRAPARAEWLAGGKADVGVSRAALLAQSPAPVIRPTASSDDGTESDAGDRPRAAPLDDNRLFVDLMLIKGHLRVGRQLLDRGDYEHAAKHFWHPVEEIYPKIAAELRRRGIVGFEGDLRYLARQAEEGETRKAAALLGEALGQIERVAARLDISKRISPEFVIPAVARLAEAAAREYEEAVAGSKFGEIREYQDGRGFVWVGREVLGAIAATLYERNPARLKKALEEYDALMAAWPSAVPPATPVMTPGRVHAQVSRVELSLSGFAPISFDDEGGEAGEAGEEEGRSAEEAGAGGAAD